MEQERAMGFGSWLAVAIFLTNLSAHGQAPAFQAAYEANQVFVLRDAVERYPAPLFYKAAVAASSNRVQAAEKYFQSLAKQALHFKYAYEAHDLLGNMYFRNGMYRECFKEIMAALRERPEGSDAKSMLSIVTALNALPKMTVVESKPSSLQMEPGSIFLPLKLNGKGAEFFFDTGAGISVIGESEAKQLRLVVKPVEGKMGDASGQGVTGVQIALVPDLLIGGLHVRNVPFVVIADMGEPWNTLPNSRHGIIGLPLLLAMHTIRWSPAGKFEFGFSSQPFKLEACNMLFHNSNPVIDVLVEKNHLDFTLDTGAVDTDLNPSFAKALPALIKSGTPESRSIQGLGGSTNSSSVLLPSVTFDIGGQSFYLRPAHVFTEHGNGTWAAGNLGMDLLKQAHAFTLDFGAMVLRLQ